jgi:hypothetical protein
LYRCICHTPKPAVPKQIDEKNKIPAVSRLLAADCTTGGADVEEHHRAALAGNLVFSLIHANLPAIFAKR